MRTRIVVHVGPAPGTAGGMASVLAALLDVRAKRYETVVLSSWAPNDRSHGLTRIPGNVLRLVLLKIVRVPALHVHLSERGSFLREGLYVLVGRALRLRVLITIHGADFLAFLGARERLVQAVLRRAHVVTVLSEEHRAVLRDRLSSPPLLVANPASASTAADAERVPGSVLFGGEVGRRKGVDVLLEAWAAVVKAVPEAHLTIAGPPGDFPPRNQAGVTWAGLQHHEALLSALARSELAVLPSRHEAQPMFLLEAMAAGTPWVSTDVAGIPALAESGAGVVVPVGDAMALAAALIRLLQDKQAREAMGSHGRTSAEQSYSPSAVVRSYEEMYWA